MKSNTALSIASIILLYIAGFLCQLDVCGRAPLNGRVVGGENATAGGWPWQVSIHIFDFHHICGGTLITKDWVLSAAYCFLGLSESQIVMYFGRLSQSGSNLNETSRTASRIIRHPNYNFSMVDNNIALVQLSSPVTFSDYIKPVCLASTGSVFPTGTESWVTGWGTGQLSDILQERMISIVSYSDCYNAFGPIITSNTICAGLLDQGAKNICPIDTGGPMVSRNGSLWIESGIVSFSRGCDDPKYPVVYTRVSQYQDWIKSYTSSNPPGFVEFMPTSNSNFGNVLNLLLFSLSLTLSIIPFTFSICLAS